MVTVNGECTRVKDDEHNQKNNQKRGKTQQEIVDKNITPWVPVLMVLLAILGTAKMMWDNHVQSRDPAEVKIEREHTAQEMFKAKAAEARAAEAKYTLNNAQVIIPSNPFPKGE